MLDLQTLSFASVISAFIAMVFFMVVWRLNTGIAGITYWLGSSILFPLALCIVPLRHVLPINVSILLGNYFNMLAVLLFYLGSRMFWQQTNINKKVIIGFTLLFIPVFYLLIHVYPSLKLRVLLVYSIAAFIMFKIIALAFYLPEKHKGVASKLLLTVCSLVTSLLIVRIVLALSFDSSTTMYEINLSNVINASLAYLLPQSFVFCALILLYERREKSIATLQQQTAYEAQLKDRYLSTLSHEMRTPLNGIVGTAQIMQYQSDTLNEQTTQYLKTIIESGQHLTELANKVLQYAAINHNKTKALSIAPVEIDKLMAQLKYIFLPDAQKKGLKLTLKKDLGVTKYLNSDATLLKSVLTNLLSNAIKYTDAGSVKLLIKRDTCKEHAVLFEIEDTGKGMSNAHFQEMLLPFTRGKEHIQKCAGTGLGLTIVQDLLNKLNSQLIHGKVDHGTKLSFVIEPSEIEAEPFDSSRLAESSIVFQKRLKILLVEDIELNIEVLTKLLEDKHHIDVARNGVQALSKLDRQQYDVVLLDIQLPDISGLDVFAQVKQQDINSSTPFIALTASVSGKELTAINNYNFFDIVEKPIIKARLLGALHNVLAKNNSEKSTDADTKTSSVIFAESPLLFLRENLAEEKFNTAINELIGNYQQDYQALSQQLACGQIENFQKLSHRLANKYGQFGLIQISEALKTFENSAVPTANELTSLYTLLKTGIAQITDYQQKNSIR